MKKILCGILMLVGVFTTHTVCAQSLTLKEVLTRVEENNRSLGVKKQENAATKEEYKTENNLPETGIDYTHQWGSRSELGHATELNVIQEFDFPTLYAQRNKLNKLRGEALDAEAGQVLNEILTTTATLCVEEVYITQLVNRLQEEEKIMQQLVKLYEGQLKNGDATITEVNDLRVEAQQFAQDLIKARLKLNDLHYELRTLNGGKNFRSTPGNAPLLSDYPLLEIPSREELKSDFVDNDARVILAQKNLEVGKKGVSIAKQGILPRLGAGFRRTTTSEKDVPTDAYNGVFVSAALPIFSQRGKVKAARSAQQTNEWELEEARLNAEQEFDALYDKYLILNSMFQANGSSTNIRALLADSEQKNETAFKEGELSMIAYLTAKHDFFNHFLSVMEKEYELQEIKIQLLKNRLSQM
jgi:outer membrane protein TolC